MDGWVDGWVGGWMGGWMDGWMDGWMPGCTESLARGAHNECCDKVKTHTSHSNGSPKHVTRSSLAASLTRPVVEVLMRDDALNARVVAIAG